MTIDKIMLDTGGREGAEIDFARALARKLGIVEQSHGNSRGEPDFILQADAGGVGLRSPRESKILPVRVDFGSRAMQRRARDDLRGQRLVRAVGTGLQVLDATAGFGRDAFLLASTGNRVQLLEREPAIYFLLADGLRRAAGDPELAPVIARMSLRHMDFCAWDETRQFDVIYLDPMFPRPRKRARGKKEMAFLQQFAGDSDEAGLLAKALRCARGRVVVKRPPRESWMDAKQPAFSYRGRVSRYDVYLP